MKNLPDFDWKPTLITRYWDPDVQSRVDQIRPSINRDIEIENQNSLTIIRVPHEPSKRDKMILDQSQGSTLRRKGLTIKEIISEFLLPRTGSTYPIYSCAREHLKNNPDYDIIIATGEPFVLMKYAHELSHEFNVPWIADYRDAWTNNHSINRPKPLKAFYRHLEKKYNTTAAALTTVSPHYHNRLINPNEIPVFTLENGYTSLLSSIPNKKGKFTLTYGGTIYNDPYVDIFIAGLRKTLKSSSFDGQVELIGIDLYSNPGVKKLHALASDYPDHISIHPRKEMKPLENDFHQSHVLVGLIPGTQSEGIIAAKTYQYLCTDSPIIMIESKRPTQPDPVHDSIEYVYSADQFSNKLLELYIKWKRGESISIDRRDLQKKISHKARTGELSKILNKFSRKK